MHNSIYTIERKMMYNDLKPLWDALSDINYAVVKGEALSLQIYGTPNMRLSGDIDILIDKDSVRTVEKELIGLGYAQFNSDGYNILRSKRILCLSHSHQIPSYHKDKFGFHFNVDINHDIFWGEYQGQRYSMEMFLSDVNTSQVFGVKIKTLPLEKAFVQLILHHYKEMNSIFLLSKCNSISSQKFKDILDIILLNNDKLTTDTINALCKKYLIGDIVYYMLYYTYCTFHDERLVPYITNLSCYHNTEIMDSYGLCAKERKKWRLSFEQRLDNDDIWTYMQNDLTDYDIMKIKRETTIFT